MDHIINSGTELLRYDFLRRLKSLGHYLRISGRLPAFPAPNYMNEDSNVPGNAAAGCCPSLRAL